MRRRFRQAGVLSAAAILSVAGSMNAALGQTESPPPPAGTPAEPPANLAPFEGRLIRTIELVGAGPENETLARNAIRVSEGQPLRAESVLADIQRLARLGRFKRIDASVRPYEDQTVLLSYVFVETPIIEDVQAVGNRQIADSKLAAEISLLANTPVDTYEVDRAARRIESLYHEKGYYLVKVGVEYEEVNPGPPPRTVVTFRISEGDRVRITDIRFDGNEAFSPGQLRSAVKSKVAGIFEKGPIDEDVIAGDVASVIKFYQDRGYLDVRVGREIRPSPNGKEAILTFVVREGRRYTLRSVRAELDDGQGGPSGERPRIFGVEQVAGLMEIKVGDVYSLDKLRRSIEAVQNAYGQQGYADAVVTKAELRDSVEPQVDLLVLITEGERSLTGLVQVSGNDLTRRGEVLRQTYLKPERPLDTTEIEKTKERLNNTRLFAPGSVKATVQDPPAEAGADRHRDVLLEVKETDTGSLSFGASVDSDGGLIGIISLKQDNFDVKDTPDSWDEFIKGRSYRGAGQKFEILLSPGTERQNYSISLSDPSLLDTDYSGSSSIYLTEREYRQYDDQRLGGRIGFGRRFGERWTATLNTRAENVDIGDIDADAPVDVFAVEGESQLSSVGVSLTRTTADSRFRPTRGTRFEGSVDQFGAIGGDYEFTRITAEHTVFLPIYEDFLGRRTVLSLKGGLGYIPQDVDDTPVFERFYLGGRTMRGFRFRTVSPKGIRNDTMTQGDDEVGGTWSLFLGTEVEQPIFDDILSGVAFIDTGTVLDEIGIEDYRVGVGVGVRLHIQQLGPVPLAFDFGLPVLKQDGDKTRIFSFFIDLPF